jgi:HJR/Mrr/RecB family endonuclease
VYEKNRTTIVDIDLMSGIEFEEFLCDYFNNHSYECKTTKTSGDQGVDLIATRHGTTLAIQAKCYEGTVGNHAIMEVVAGTKFYNADQSMVITNSTFTKSAIELAKANGVILWDRQVLIEKLANN